MLNKFIRLIKNLFLVVFLISTIILGVTSYYFYNQVALLNNKLILNKTLNVNPNANNNIESEDIVENTKINLVSKSPIDIKSLDTTGWFPDWASDRGVSSLQNNPELFKRISPVLYTLKDDGSLNYSINKNSVNTLLNYAKKNNIQIYPTISSFSSSQLNLILNNSSSFQTHVNSIISEVTMNNYDGIDLDYEVIEYNDKEVFYQFLNTLSSKLHLMNKKLIFTSFSKWGDKVSYWSILQTRKVLDFKKISDFVDELRIMAYDYYGKASSKAGPLSPIKWDELIIKYAIYVGVPREKITLALPLYAYDLADRELTTNNLDFLNIDTSTINSDGKESGNALTYTGVNNLIKKFNITPDFNNSWVENIASYNLQGKKRTIIFMSSLSLQLRKQLAADYGIKGVCYWSIGYEGDLKL